MAQLEKGLHTLSSPRLDMDRFIMNSKEAGADSDHESETTDRLSAAVEQLQQQLEAEKERVAKFQRQLEEAEQKIQQSAGAGKWLCVVNQQLNQKINELLAAQKEREAAAAVVADGRGSPPFSPTTPRGAERRGSWEQGDSDDGEGLGFHGRVRRSRKPCDRHRSLEEVELSSHDMAELQQLKNRLEHAEEEQKELMAANIQLEDDNKQLSCKIRELEAEVESLEEQSREKEASSRDRSPQPPRGSCTDGWRHGAGGATSKRRRPTRVRLCTPMDLEVEEDMDVGEGDVAPRHVEEDEEEEEEEDPQTRLQGEVKELLQRCEMLETDLRNEKAHHTALELERDEFHEMWEKEKSCAAELQQEVERQRVLLDTRNSESAARQLCDEEASSQVDPTARRVSTAVGVLDLSDRRISRVSHPRRSMISLHAETTEAIEDEDEEDEDEDGKSSQAGDAEDPPAPVSGARSSSRAASLPRASKGVGDTLQGFLEEAGGLPEGFTLDQAASRLSAGGDSGGQATAGALWGALLDRAAMKGSGETSESASSSSPWNKLFSASPAGGAGGWSGVFSAFADASAALPPRKRM